MKKIFIIDWSLIPVFVLSAYSGIELHVADYEGNHEEELQNQLASFKKNNYAKEYADAVYKQRVMQQYNLYMNLL